MSDDRAERLRNRRAQAGESDASKPSETDESGETDDGDESVKDDRVGTYMYLSEDQAEAVSMESDRLRYEVKQAGGGELEKNRHLYPLLIQHGLETLQEWDGQDVLDAL